MESYFITSLYGWPFSVSGLVLCAGAHTLRSPGVADPVTHNEAPPVGTRSMEWFQTDSDIPRNYSETNNMATDMDDLASIVNPDEDIFRRWI